MAAVTKKIGVPILLVVGAIAAIWIFFNWYYGADNVKVVLVNELHKINNQTVEQAPPESSKDNTNENLSGVSKQTGAVLINVPFASQAPYGDWEDPYQQDGCEEASLIMAKHWITGEWLNKANALDAIKAVSAWEETAFNGALSLSVEDTVRMAKEYFKIEDVTIVREATIEDIKSALDDGKIVVVEVDGKKLNNPHFTPPGPTEHMLVVTGYNDIQREFITNDPGTKVGQGYHYPYETLYGALQDYPTGHKEPIETVTKSLIVIGRS
jgi:hypothetical protein